MSITYHLENLRLKAYGRIQPPCCETCRKTMKVVQLTEKETVAICFTKDCITNLRIKIKLNNNIAKKKEDLVPYFPISFAHAIHKYQHYCDALMSETLKTQEQLMGIWASFKLGKRKNLFLHSMPGTGKTYTMIGMLKDLMAENEMNESINDSIYVNEVDYFNRLKATFNQEGPATETVLKKYHDVPILFFDDFGASIRTMSGDWGHQVIYDLLDHRLSNDLCTVMASNVTFEEIKENYKERITDRLKFFTNYEFLGTSRRESIDCGDGK